VFSPEKRSEVMSKIRGKNTKIELKLRKELWKRSIRGYRLQTKLPGRPDILFAKYKVVVFCDGDFWHGFLFDEWKKRLQPFWLNKIAGNMKRDQQNDSLLQEHGFIVVHLWEHELEKNIGECVQKVIDALKSRGFMI
jgi:DNA mismatch endonuclease, patch repair protein